MYKLTYENRPKELKLFSTQREWAVIRLSMCGTFSRKKLPISTQQYQPTNRRCIEQTCYT